MRRVMNVGELKRYYEGRSLRRILFCTENQAWDKVENPVKVSLVREFIGGNTFYR